MYIFSVAFILFCIYIYLFLFRFRHQCRGATRKFTVFSTLDEKKKIDCFGAGFSGHF